MPPLKLPTLYCPFSAPINRHAAVVDQHALSWAHHWQLIRTDADERRLRMMELGWLAGRTHPDATRPALQLITDWCVWLFIHDDHCDEAGLGRQPLELAALHRHLLALLDENCPACHDPLVDAFANLVQRTRLVASPGWLLQFQRSVADFFQAGVWEATNRALAQRPDLATYRQMRPYTSGMYAYIDLIEVIDDVPLPSAVQHHPVVNILKGLVINAACWVNDILSVMKELQHGDVHNLVLALQHKDQLSLQDAVDRAGALHDAEVRTFVDTVSRLPDFGTATNDLLQRYITVLKSYMRGNLDWSCRTGRYVLAELEYGR